jgi:regulator of protease activity HflC (stomatin/prohibitin superfamily)
VIRLASARGVAHRMRSATDQNMQVRTRKLIGTILLLLFLAVYATAAAVIGSGRIALAPQWVQFAFYLTTGLLWVIPAGLLVRWMQRPD